MTKKISLICKSILTLIIVFAVLTGCGGEYIPPPRDNVPDIRDKISNDVLDGNENESQNSESGENSKSQSERNTDISRGYKKDIPADIREKMKGVSMPDGATVSFDDLAYLSIPHYNFDDGISLGHMVVDKELADEVLDIFKELFLIEFPIERMEIIDKFVPYIDDTFNTLDRASMSHNNTSSFCYRPVAGTEKMSYHAYGRAIDINPKTNPYCILSTGYVSPSNAYEYADRTKDFPGMIHHGDEVYKIFIEHGWEWGGDWYDEKDYQHFQKR